MSAKQTANPIEQHEASTSKPTPNPEIESNSQSRHHHEVIKAHELQEEQFISHPVDSKGQKVVYGNPVAGNETVREATMTLYNSLNASDHI